MKLHFGSPDAFDYEGLLALYDDNGFQNLTRSTIPLLEYWHHNYPAAQNAFRALGIELDEQHTSYYYEYPTPSLHLAKASFTDLMIIGSDFAVAIEWKWTEPRYPTLGEWKSSGKDRAFRDSVLDHWLSIIRHTVGHTGLIFISHQLPLLSLTLAPTAFTFLPLCFDLSLR